ncbi:hypothetical protein [Aeoliella sp. SH292]|uniref:hypothetical protein n=1 Tax=Aeoliella sp. SH292 TaxID=3454464 RepID=UPI003F9DD2CC
MPSGTHSGGMRLAIVASCLLVLMVGCNKPKSDRMTIEGAVTWKGQPVPAGRVYFTPDESKGGSGPQGYAMIVNGRYDTGEEKSKGCHVGPHFAEVHGFDGQGSEGFGSPLFAPYSISIEVPADGGTIDLEVPADARPPIEAGEE